MSNGCTEVVELDGSELDGSEWTITSRDSRLSRALSRLIDMDIRLSSAARNRAFSKSLARVRPTVECLLEDIRSQQLGDPTWSVLMLTLTDDLPPESVKEMGDDNGMLQLFVGFPELDDWTSGNDKSIRTAVIDSVRIALDHCGLTPTDRELLETCFQ